VYANVNNQTLFRVDLATGAQVTVVSGFGYATGIDIHPDGHVFIGDADRIKRVDPYTGEVAVVFRRDEPGFINGISFSESFEALYFGTRDEIWRVAVDADGVPTASPERLWTAPSGSPELLGLGVDACGNLYGLSGGRLLRFSGGTGAPELLMDGGGFTTNLQWGSGIGGWDALAVYVTDRGGDSPYYEVDVGVPAKQMPPR
jgi:sugar lactone lactonase YvrE